MHNRLTQLIKIAIRETGSDIHISVNEDLKIECRTSAGFLNIPLKERDELLLNYLQYLSNMDIAIISKPQSGSFVFEMNNSKYYCRFALLSSLKGRNGVLRIMNETATKPLDKLIYKGEHRALFKSWCELESGLVLFGGATGAGKTTTVYSMLNYMKEKKVYTLEDPIEVVYPQLTQVQINADAGLDYKEGIRQLLRHDPDVVMIAEIRDEATAQAAIRCALTGHLVISTIHASNCVGMLNRFMELGISNTELMNVLKGIACQKLFKLSTDEKRFSLYEVYECHDISNYLQNKIIKEHDFNKEIEYAYAKNWLC